MNRLELVNRVEDVFMKALGALVPVPDIRTDLFRALVVSQKLDRSERNTLVYVESCCVDENGILDPVRMNKEDYENLEKFSVVGILRFGRIPRQSRFVGNWVQLTPLGWEVSQTLRRHRAVRARDASMELKQIFDEVDLHFGNVACALCGSSSHIANACPWKLQK